VLVLGVFIVAVNMRPAITSMGPVIDLVGDDAGLSTAGLGLLAALPLIAFGLVSPFVHRVTERQGPERTVLIALLVLAAGVLLRSTPGWWGTLWIGTAVIGVGIAVCNVVAPVIVKRDFPLRVALVTGAYSALAGGFAAIGSGITVPLENALGGWRPAVGVWAVLALVCALLWLPRVRGARAEAAAGLRASAAPSAASSAAPSIGPVGRAAPGASMWRSVPAWQVTVFMGLQATNFFLLVTWLPSIERSDGLSAVDAGWYLFLFQMASVVGGIAVTALMRGHADQRRTAAVVSAVMMVAVCGLLVAPAALLLWVGLAGVSAGSAIVVALSLVGLRTRTPQEASSLSGMTQGVGYLVAASGPFLAGALHTLTGSWVTPLLLVVAVSIAQLVVGIRAAAPGYTHPVDAPRDEMASR
jgi:CP family cyanate transporter-like MFS transporter